MSEQEYRLERPEASWEMESHHFRMIQQYSGSVKTESGWGQFWDWSWISKYLVPVYFCECGKEINQDEFDTLGCCGDCWKGVPLSWEKPDRMIWSHDISEAPYDYRWRKFTGTSYCVDCGEQLAGSGVWHGNQNTGEERHFACSCKVAKPHLEEVIRVNRDGRVSVRGKYDFSQVEFVEAMTGWGDVRHNDGILEGERRERRKGIQITKELESLCDRLKEASC